uniref:Uncharacterized protein n=1 Tax=Arundo donax TaxID=35708 RepID=A0A0A9EX09_ARUDO
MLLICLRSLCLSLIVCSIM